METTTKNSSETPDFQGSSLFWAGNVLLAVLAPVSLALNLLCLKILTKTKLVDATVRVLLGHISVWFSIQAVYVFGKTVSNLYWLSSEGVPLPMNYQTCIILDSVVGSMSQIILASFLSLSFERLFVSICIPGKDYLVQEDKVNRSVLAIAGFYYILPFALLIMKLNQTADRVSQAEFPETMMYCDTSMISTQGYSQVVKVMYLILEVGCCVPFFAAYVITKRKLASYAANQALLNLRNRILLSRCKQNADILLKSIVAQLILIGGRHIYDMLTRFDIRKRFIDVATENLFDFYLIYLILGIVHPGLVLYGWKRSRSALGLSLLSNKVKPIVATVNQVEDGSLRMKNLQTMWDRAYDYKGPVVQK